MRCVTDLRLLYRVHALTARLDQNDIAPSLSRDAHDLYGVTCIACPARQRSQLSLAEVK